MLTILMIMAFMSVIGAIRTIHRQNLEQSRQQQHLEELEAGNTFSMSWRKHRNRGSRR